MFFFNGILTLQINDLMLSLKLYGDLIQSYKRRAVDLYAVYTYTIIIYYNQFCSKP